MSTLQTYNLKHPDASGNQITFTSGGDVNFDNGAVYLDSTNNRLGIGTSSPASKLVVSNAGAEGWELGSTSGTVELVGYNRSTSARSPMKVIGQTFLVQTGNPSLTNGLYQDSSGAVGIGTTSPFSDAKLTVDNGGSGDVSIAFSRSAAGQNDVALVNSSGEFIVKNGVSSTVSGLDEALRVDTSGRLLVGTSSNSGNSLLQVAGDSSSVNASGSIFLHSNYASASLGGGDGLGIISAGSNNGGVGGSIQFVADATWGSGDYPTRLVFSTTPSGSSSPTERMRIKQDGEFLMSDVYTRTDAASVNVVVKSDGSLRRSVSSIKYKTEVETLQDSYADAILNVRPVWYRSLCDGNSPEHSWWGFIAEEVAEIDPRLVHWKTTEPVVQDDGSLEHVPCEPEPEGVAYDRFVPHLLNLIKRQKEQIEAMEARLSALESA